MLTVAAVAIRFAGTCAVSWVALTTLVASAVAPHWTTAPVRKPVPVTVRVKAALPATTLGGLNDVMDGALMAKARAFDAEPWGFLTVTLAEPALAIKSGAIMALNCVVLPKVVESAVPFHWIVAPFWKPLPVTVRGNCGPPAKALFGLKLLIENGVMVNISVLGAAGPVGFLTDTVAEPAVAMRLAGTVAVS